MDGFATLYFCVKFFILNSLKFFILNSLKLLTLISLKFEFLLKISKAFNTTVDVDPSAKVTSRATSEQPLPRSFSACAENDNWRSCWWRGTMIVISRRRRFAASRDMVASVMSREKIWCWPFTKTYHKYGSVISFFFESVLKIWSEKMPWLLKNWFDKMFMSIVSVKLGENLSNDSDTAEMNLFCGKANDDGVVTEQTR